MLVLIRLAEASGAPVCPLHAGDYNSKFLSLYTSTESKSLGQSGVKKQRVIYFEAKEATAG